LVFDAAAKAGETLLNVNAKQFEHSDPRAVKIREQSKTALLPRAKPSAYLPE